LGREERGDRLEVFKNVTCTTETLALHYIRNYTAVVLSGKQEPSQTSGLEPLIERTQLFRLPLPLNPALDARPFSSVAAGRFPAGRLGYDPAEPFFFDDEPPRPWHSREQ
jgi:hypothetical protein